MRSLRSRRTKSDPAPSRWAYKLQRVMLTPGVRFMLRAGIPFALVAGLGTMYLSDPARQAKIQDTVAEMRDAIETRDEFMVKLMAVDGASPDVAQDIRTLLPLEFPISSFDLDLAALRETVAQLEVIKDVTLRIKSGGVLQVQVVEREPVVVWRTRDGLALLDETGVEVGEILIRAARSDLPLVAGEGAEDHVVEALTLFRTAQPLGERLRGLVRVGERRWDVVLNRDQRIMLPPQDAVQALERVIALTEAQDVLARDVAAIDMRLSERPTLKMNPRAVSEMWRISNPQQTEQAND